MQARMFRRLVLALGTLALAGCTYKESAATEPGPVALPRPFVFYDDKGEPSQHNPALSEHELQEITARVATQTSDPIWLIRVKSSYANGIHFSVVAHLAPDEISPRVRVGRAYDLSVSEEQSDICSPWEYAQVSMPGRNFDEQLTKPSATEMPFAFPYIVGPDRGKSSPMSKQEAVGIVDFVRLPSTYKDMRAQGGWSKDAMIQAILEFPVLDIRREGNEITVMFGYMHGPLWGYGLMVEFECTPSGYKVKSWGEWVS
jgi:hypothetical protein